MAHHPQTGMTTCPMTQLIAILDIGKTNAKLSFVDPQSSAEVWSTRRSTERLNTPLLRQLDVHGIEQWLLESLRTAPQTSAVVAIVPIAHGAAAVLIDEHNEILAAPDYEDPCFSSLDVAYETQRDPFEETYSPSLPLGLNLARQFFYLEKAAPELQARTAHILLYPQFWAWRLSGVLASEVTSLGCHTDLWRPARMGFSSLALRHRWSEGFPALRFAGDTLGTVTPQIAARTGLDPQCRVVCGIHDSNASYLQHLIDRPRGRPFSVISSGTWTVIMSDHADLRRLQAERDMLANVDAFGVTTGTARFMGGREYEVIAQGADPPTADGLAEVLRERAFALPSFAAGGPFPGITGRLVDAANLSSSGRAALASVYVALMSDLQMEMLDLRGDVLIDGPLAPNPLFGRLLATWRPGNRILAHTAAGGASTRAGSYLAGMDSAVKPAPILVEPFDLPQLHAYRGAWHDLLPT
jgi:L-fuculokinase